MEPPPPPASKVDSMLTMSLSDTVLMMAFFSAEMPTIFRLYAVLQRRYFEFIAFRLIRSEGIDSGLL